MTFLGIVGAGDRRPIPESGREPGTNEPIYHWPNQFGFFIAAEFRPGPSRRPVGQSTFNHDPNDPGVLPDFQIKSEQSLGTPTAEVCDAGTFGNAMVGGVPGVTTDGFGGTQFAANAINDLSCRFAVRVSSDVACTDDEQGNHSFVMTAPPLISTIQFCAPVGSELALPSGMRTRITVRGRDTLGQPGAARSMIVEIE